MILKVYSQRKKEKFLQLFATTLDLYLETWIFLLACSIILSCDDFYFVVSSTQVKLYPYLFASVLIIGSDLISSIPFY